MSNERSESSLSSDGLHVSSAEPKYNEGKTKGLRSFLTHLEFPARPPGHHSMRSAANGFCVFNNVAIAARYARQKYGLER